MPDQYTIPNRALLVKRDDNTNFRFIVRWNLLHTWQESGQYMQQSRFPGPDDYFDVTLSRGTSADPTTQFYLKEDGTWSAAGAITTIQVIPRRAAMLIPPQLQQDETFYYDYVEGGSASFFVGTEPGQVINESDNTKEQFRADGFGVAHLLKGIAPSTVVSEGQAFLKKKVSAGLKDGHNILLKGGDEEKLSDEFSLHLATLLRKCPRGPRHRLNELKKASLHLSQKLPEVKDRILDKQQLSVETKSHFSNYGQQIMRQHGFDRFADPDQLQELVAFNSLLHRSLNFSEREQQKFKTIFEDTANTTGAIGTRIGSGGKMIDYWDADPQNRGQQFYTADLVGLGLTIGDITQAELDEWIAAGLFIQLSVSYTEHPSVLGLPLTAYSPVQTLINTPLLTSASQNGSSMPVPPPMQAAVNYDLIDMNPEKAETSTVADDIMSTRTALSYANMSGDQFLKLKVYTPRVVDPAVSSQIAGVNIYGIWEDLNYHNDLKQFFDDPTSNPTLTQLKPWLITRYYSYEYDLKLAIGAAAQAQKDLALSNPPYKALLINAQTDIPGQTMQTIDQDGKVSSPLPTIPAIYDPEGITKGAYISIYSLDLRKGMKYGTKPGEERMTGWDPLLPVKPDWTPEMDRRGKVLTAPQRYRFWITTVDSFDQESTPVPVLTSDDGESQSYIYSPKYRIPVSTATFEPGQNLSVSPDKRTLSASWETPYVNRGNDYAKKSDDLSAMLTRADARNLYCHLKIFRRLLKRKIDPAHDLMRLSLSLTLAPPFDNPNWTSAINALVIDNYGNPTGWAEWKTLTGINSTSATNDVWTATAHLELNDQGYEYMALLGVTVKDNWLPFWKENMTSRSLWYFKTNTDISGNSTYVPQQIKVAESPITSGVVRSQVCTVPNINPSKGVSKAGILLRQVAALPVLSVPDVNEDQILFKLLNYKIVNQGVDDGLHPWPTTDGPAQISFGQSEMITRALMRCGYTIADVTDPSSVNFPALEIPRQVLLADFKEQTGQVHYNTIGFRGLAGLRWRYDSIVSSAAETRAEATKIRFFQTRIPKITAFENPQEEAAFISSYSSFVIAQCTLSGPFEYTCTVPAGDERADSLNKMNGGGHPLSVIITDQQNTRLLYTVTVISVVPGTATPSFKIKLDPNGAAFDQAHTTLPGLALIGFKIGVQIAEIENPDIYGGSEQEVLLPVGGGNNEFFIWWVATASAQDIQCSFPDMLPVIKEFPTSLTPPAPILSNLRPPVSNEYYTDPVILQQWAPSEINGNAHDLPRLILSWRGKSSSTLLLADDVLLMIERDQKRLNGNEAIQKSLLEADLTAWYAIGQIQLAKAGDGIEHSWVEALSQKWLLGQVIDFPDTSSGHSRLTGPDSTLYLKRNVEMKSDTGVFTLSNGLASFIDYFKLPDDMNSVMNEDWIYRYRLTNYVRFGGTLLYSSPSGWTDWLRPGAPPIEVALAVKPEQITGIRPQIQFKFVRSTNAQQRIRLTDLDYKTFFSIQIRRQAVSNILGTGNIAFVDIGDPVYIDTALFSTSPDTVPVVNDFGLERTLPDSAENYNYYLFIQEFLVFGSGSAQSKELIRKQANYAPLPVLLPAPPDDNTEVKLTGTFTID